MNEEKKDFKKWNNKTVLFDSWQTVGTQQLSIDFQEKIKESWVRRQQEEMTMVDVII
jgi:hypothetical protein